MGVDREGKQAAVRCGRREACPVADPCVPGETTPCLDMSRAHDRKLQLCDALESLADTLPFQVDRMTCLTIAATLVPLLRESHRYEEEIVFPAFASSGDGEARARSISRLKSEHVEDECSAQDLTDALLAIGHGSDIENPEALGFMLRALFEALRRHIAFEREHVLPVVAALDETQS